MPRLELKGWRTFLAIKRCQRTKIRKVVKLSRSSKKSGRRYATIAVKLLIGKYSISPRPMVGLDRRLNPPGADCRAHAAKAIFPNIYLLIDQGGKAAACLCAAVFASLCAVWKKKKKGKPARWPRFRERGNRGEKKGGKEKKKKREEKRRGGKVEGKGGVRDNVVRHLFRP